MANFEKAVGKIFIIEGGWVDDPDDSGGATMKGITLRTYSEYLGRPATKEALRNISDSVIKEIYKKNYWDKLNADAIPDQIMAEMIVDQGVNRGVYTAARDVQQVLNAKFGEKLYIDGKLGAKSIEALTSADPEDFMTEFLIESELEYNSIIKNNTKNLKFINGWTNRRAALWRSLTKGLNRNAVTTAPEAPPSSGLMVVLEKFAQALIEFFNVPETVPEVPTPPSTSVTVQDQFKAIKSKRPDISPKMLLMGLEAREKNKALAVKPWLLTVDFDLHSSKKRLWLTNMSTFESSAYPVTHGKNSDLNNDGVAESFSNVNGSNKSSLGAMLTLSRYASSKFAQAMRLKGLDSQLNSNVLARAIVLHSSDYATLKWLEAHGSLGRSLGCFALQEDYAKQIIDLTANGTLLFAYHKSLDA